MKRAAKNVCSTASRNNTVATALNGSASIRVVRTLRKLPSAGTGYASRGVGNGASAGEGIGAAILSSPSPTAPTKLFAGRCSRQIRREEQDEPVAADAATG